MSGKAVVQFRQRRKRWAVDAFGGKCGICGYNKCVEALEFHHLDPNEKDFQLGRRGMHRHDTNWEKVKIELDKCILVCANCHRELHNLNDRNFETISKSNAH